MIKKDLEQVLSKQVRKLPLELRRSLTWDRGMELAQHKKLTVRPMFKFTSVIQKVLGSEAPTKIQTAYYVNTSRKVRICLDIHRLT